MRHSFCTWWFSLLTLALVSGVPGPLAAQEDTLDPTTEIGVAPEAEESPDASLQGTSEDAGPSEPPLAEQLHGSALEEYRAAHIAYRDGDHAGARLKFLAAYEASGNPRLLWNVAACEKALRNYAGVVETLRRYEREMGAALSMEKRAQAARLLEAIAAYVGEIDLTVSEEGATVSVDGEERGRTPLYEPLLVTHGRRELAVHKEGFEPFARGLLVEGRKTMHVSIELEPSPHEGTLVVEAGAGEAIYVNGKPVGIAHYRGVLPSGKHDLRVEAKGKETYVAQVEIRDGQTDTVRVQLSSDTRRKRRRRILLGVTAGVVVAAGAGVGAYYLLRDDTPSYPPADLVVRY